MVPGYVPDPWRNYHRYRVAAMSGMPGWAGKAASDSYTELVTLQYTEDVPDGAEAVQEEKYRVKHLLSILDACSPINHPDLITFYTILFHISYLFSLPQWDVYLHDKKGTDRNISDFHGREAEEAIT